MAILVTGGAGYIGSHAVAELLARGEDVVVLDNLRTGHREAVLTPCLHVGDIADDSLLDRIFHAHDVEAVMHFAALSVVGESVCDPLAYYDNNVAGTACLLAAMKRHGVSLLVFSSTAAVYGSPTRVPLHEDDATLPTNPYGDTKLAIERMLAWCERAHGLRSVSLRYFNAAGAHPIHDIGEDHAPETHLVPLVLQTALGQRERITIFGDDYDTPDGTCVRDYIHVIDLADAHWRALQRLRQGASARVYNLGNGRGFSVREVVACARAVTGAAIDVMNGPRRAGDPPMLVASSERARNELGWEPQHGQLEDIVASAWRWHRAHPRGFSASVALR